MPEQISSFYKTPEKQDKIEVGEIWKESLGFISDLELRKKIEIYVTNPENYLGKGGAAIVFSLDNKCIKLLKNRNDNNSAGMYDLGNSIDQEFKIQGLLDNFKVDEVVSPRTLSYFKGGENTAMVMERLDAVNLQMAILGREPLPENFNPEDFCERLESYVYEMHDLGVAHGDLFAKNVMIDKKSGHPRVIDFGRSKFSLSRYNKHLKENDDSIIDDKTVEADLNLPQATKEEMFKKVMLTDIENLDDVMKKILNIKK